MSHIHMHACTDLYVMTLDFSEHSQVLHTYACMYVCICVYIYIHTHIYICMYIDSSRNGQSGLAFLLVTFALLTCVSVCVHMRMYVYLYR